MESKDLGTLFTPLHKRQKIPIFAGFTETGEKIVLYVCGQVFHLKIPDGSVWALGSSDGMFELSYADLDGTACLSVSSPVWSGKAVGTRKDTIEEPSLP
jgi:hypothetical protein